MAYRFVPALLRASALLLVAAPVCGQDEVVLRGRVEDASSRAPIAGARVLSADSSSAVITDPRGGFAIEVAAGGPLTLHVQRFGYVSRRFDLPDDARLRISVLQLEADPVELEGIEAVAEAALRDELTPERLSSAVLTHGRAIFDQNCAKCHKLFGEGGTGVETIGDTAMALPPLDAAIAATVIADTRIGRDTPGHGMRGRAPACREPAPGPTADTAASPCRADSSCGGLLHPADTADGT